MKFSRSRRILKALAFAADIACKMHHHTYNIIIHDRYDRPIYRTISMFLLSTNQWIIIIVKLIIIRNATKKTFRLCVVVRVVWMWHIDLNEWLNEYTLVEHSNSASLLRAFRWLGWGWYVWLVWVYASVFVCCIMNDDGIRRFER